MFIAMTDSLRLTAIYEDVDGGWTQGRLLELPGVITAAPTREEAGEMLRDATLEFLASFSSPTVETDPGADVETIRLVIVG